MTSAPERKVFTLLVEMRCNSYCIFCGQRQVDEGVVKARRTLGLATPRTNYGDLRGRFTLETATRALERAREEGYDELSLQGGEPTLFPDLVELVRAARGMGFRFIGLVTNGRRLKEAAFARALLLAGLDAMTFSVLGHDARTHDALAIAPGAFDELVQGLRNSARAATERVSLNVSLVTSKDTVRHLAAQVKELHEAGARALSIHLVRFDGLASDPLVESAVAFDIRELTPAIEGAWAVAEQVGASLHATDVPLCLHPEFRPNELALLERRAARTKHHFGAATFAYDLDERERPPEIPCEGCVVAGVCPRVPPEYLPPDPKDALRPVTRASLEEGVLALLSGLDPGAPASVARVRDRKWSLAAFSRLGGMGADLRASVARLDEGLEDLAALAFGRGDASSVVLAFASRVGVHAPEWSAEDVVRWGHAATGDLARASGGVPAGHEGGAWRLCLAEGFEVALEGELGEGKDELRVARARLVHRVARGQGDRLFLALFLGGLSAAFRGAGGVRLVSGAIEVDRGDGWRRALWLDSASTARWVEPRSSE